MNKQKKGLFSSAILFILMLLMMMPFYIMIIGAFKNNSALMILPPDLNPLKNMILDNLFYVVGKSDILTWLLNSFAISLSVAVLVMFISATAGYAFAKIGFCGRGIFFAIVIATMILPKQILLIPNFLVALKLGLKDTLIGVILTSVSPPFGIFLCRQFMVNIPTELIEAAEIDGCGEVRKFSSVIVPLSWPAMGAVGIFAFFGVFSDYLWQLIMISSKTLQTVPIGIAMFAQKSVTNVGYQFMAAAIVTLPIIVIFLCCQNFFIKGVTFGGVKG